MSRSRIRMDATLVENVKTEVELYIEENKYWPHKRAGVARMRKYLQRLRELPQDEAEADKIVIGDYLSTSVKGPLGDSVEMRDRIGEVIRMQKNIRRNELLQIMLSEKLKLRLLQKNYEDYEDPIVDPILKNLFQFKIQLKKELQSELNKEEKAAIESDEILAPIWHYFLAVKNNLKKGLCLENIKLEKKLSDEEIEKLVEKSINQFFLKSFNRIIEPAIRQKLNLCFNKSHPENHKALINDRFDREFNESVQKEVMNSVVLLQSGNDVRRLRIASYLLQNNYLPSEDHDLHGEEFKDDLRGHLKKQTRLYQVVDNPKNPHKLIDGGALGRARVAAYSQEVDRLSFDLLSEEKLFIKMLRDYMYFDERSSLGSSEKFRERIGNAICRFMGITGEVMLHFMQLERGTRNSFDDMFYKHTYAFKHAQTCKLICRYLPQFLIENPNRFPQIVGDERRMFGENILQEVLKKDTKPKLDFLRL